MEEFSEESFLRKIFGGESSLGTKLGERSSIGIPDSDPFRPYSHTYL
jgi:hypothetical protein